MSKVLRDLEFLLLVLFTLALVEEDTILSTFHMLYDNRMLELTSTGVEYWADADGWLAPYNHSIVQPNVVSGSVNLLMN